MMMRRIVEPILFWIATIPTMYVALSRGLGGDFALSPENAEFALILGSVGGALVALILTPFQFSHKSGIRKTGRVVGVLLELLGFTGVFVWVAAMSSI
jgi:hypothetical protein